MANIYDSIYDCSGIFRFSNRLQRRAPPRLFLMDIQLVISIALVFFAFAYMLRSIIIRINNTDLKPQCDECNMKQNTIQAEALASRGYLVVSTDHMYDANISISLESPDNTSMSHIFLILILSNI